MMMDILLVAISMSIHAAFIWRRKLLFEKKSFMILLALSTLFFFLSYVLLQANVGNPKMVALIRVPLLALIVFLS
jgi:hypothetical protein